MLSYGHDVIENLISGLPDFKTRLIEYNTIFNIANDL